MRIVLQKSFRKSLERLTPKMRDKVRAAIYKFRSNPFDPTLRNHPLKGSMVGRRAFSVGGDMRIIFKEYENYTMVLMLDVGSHNQVY